VEGRQILNSYVAYGQAPATTAAPDALRTVLRSRLPVVSDLFISQVARAPVYTVSMPVLRDGRVQYVMSLALLTEELRTLVESQALPSPWTTTIWDGKGIVLARSPDHAKFVGTAVAPGLRGKATAAVFRLAADDGSEHFAAVARPKGANWGIAVAFPVSVAERRLRQSLWLGGGAIVLVGALAAAAALLFGRELTRPLAAAAAGAGALGRGETLVLRYSRLKEANAVNDALKRARDDLDGASVALRASEEQLRTAAEAAQFGAHEYDVAADRTHRSPQLLQIFGAGEVGPPTFESGLAFVHPDDREATRFAKQQILLGRDEHYEVEYRILRPDGQVRWVMDRGRVTRDGDGRALRVVGVVLDITRLKEAEQRQRLLFDELNHRVKNTLAIVQSLAQQTVRTKPDPREFATAFQARLASLAKAHSLLTHDSWRGAALHDIASTAMAAFIDEGRRIHIAGDPVTVPASTTITLSLMLHELATNAAKYGALSVATGRLSIEWSVAEAGSAATIELCWKESNGPPVASGRSPGFGSRLLAGGAQQLNAKLDIDYAAGGLECHLRFAVARSPAGESPPRSGLERAADR
jgi:PAS domain S-box-containing protein